MTFTLANIKAAGSRVTEYHAPFKAEGTDIRNAFGVIVGAGIDEVHANAFAAAGNMRPALEAAEHWIEEQAWSPIAENGEILRTIRDALGKPHDAPDAAPSAPQTPAPDLSLPDYEAQARAAGWSLYRLEDGCGATDVEFYAWRGGNVLEPEHETSAVADEATAWRDACNHDAMLAANAAEGREG